MICTIWNWLINVEKNSSTDYLLTIISMSVAAFVIFLSLSVIPFQKISTEISGRIYELFLKQKKFVAPVLINLFICIIQILFYTFVPSNNLVKICYLFSLIIILINAYKYTKKIKSELDISYTIYPLIESDFDKAIKKLFETEKKLKNNPIYRKNENEKIISITILYQINPKDYKYGLPFDGYDRIFLYKFQTLYEVLINSLDKYEYGSFEKQLILCFHV